MAVATIALALASAERTFEGMRNFTGASGDQQWLSVPVSVLITLGVQLLMVYLSWLIGDVHASDARRIKGPEAQQPTAPRRWACSLRRAIAGNFIFRHYILIGSFAVCVAICVFFSFDAFYQGISTTKQRDIVSRNEAFRALRATTAGLAKDLADTEEMLAATLSSGRAWEAYKSEIDGVIRIATDPTLVEADKALAQQRAEEAKNRAEQISNRVEVQKKALIDAEAEVTQLSRERDRLAAVVRESREVLTGLKERRGSHLKAIADKEAEIAEARKQMDAEETIGSNRLNKRGQLDTGRGPKWIALQARYQFLVKEKTDLDATTPKLDGDLAKAETGSQSADKDLGDAEHALAVSKENARAVEARNDALAATEPEQAHSDDVIASAAAEARSLSQLPPRFFNKPFSERTPDDWAAIEKQCIKVVNAVRDIPGGRAKAASLSCEPPAQIRELATNFFALAQRQKEFEQECTGSLPSASTFLQLIEHGKMCLHIAQLQDKVASGLEEDLDRVAEEQDEKAHTFVRTISAFQRGDKLAYIAAAIAVSLDGLILLAGIWGARASASELTRGTDIAPLDIDSHAEMAMAVETRPDKLRPASGWPEPPEVYKARLFYCQIRHFHDAAHAQYGGIIYCDRLGEQERAVIDSVLAIGPFVQPFENRPQPDTWLVSWRLIHYVTAIVGKFDRLQRIGQAGVQAQSVASYASTAQRQGSAFAGPSMAQNGPEYWMRAAAAAKSGPAAASEAELAERDYIDRVQHGFRSDEITEADENDNSVVDLVLPTLRKGRASPPSDLATG
jgi:hypothetical protein